MFPAGSTVYKAHVGTAIDYDGRLPAWIEQATVARHLVGGHQLVMRAGHFSTLAGEWHSSHELARRRLVEMLLERADGIIRQVEALAPEAAAPPRTLDGLIDVIFGPIVVHPQTANGAPS